MVTVVIHCHYRSGFFTSWPASSRVSLMSPWTSLPSCSKCVGWGGWGSCPWYFTTTQLLKYCSSVRGLVVRQNFALCCIVGMPVGVARLYCLPLNAFFPNMAYRVSKKQCFSMGGKVRWCSCWSEWSCHVFGVCGYVDGLLVALSNLSFLSFPFEGFSPTSQYGIWSTASTGKRSWKNTGTIPV